MAHALADRSSPRALASARQAIEFKGQIQNFSRLAQVVAEDLERLDAAERPADWRKSPVTVALDFAFADVGESLPIVTGRLQLELPAVCQRCLEPCRVAVDSTLHYLLAEGAATTANEEFEVWELDGPTLVPAELVEEALILALPVVAMHADRSECGTLAAQSDSVEQVGEPSRPFAALREQMKSGK